MTELGDSLQQIQNGVRAYLVGPTFDERYVLTVYEPRWHGFARWTLELRTPVPFGFLSTPIRSGFAKRRGCHVWSAPVGLLTRRGCKLTVRHV